MKGCLSVANIGEVCVNTAVTAAGLVLLAPLAAALGSTASHAAGNPCDPTTYGAVNDGVTDNATAIQRAIDTCAANGGGVVPLTGGGTFVTGPIALRSHITLQIMAPTVLKNTLNHYAYQPAFIGYPFRFVNDPSLTGGVGPSFTGKPEAMISANGVTDVAIIGNGTIDGSGADNPPANIDGGQSWWTMATNTKAVAAAGAPPCFAGTTITCYTAAIITSGTNNAASYAGQSFSDIVTSNGLPRPFLVEFYNCTNVTVNGVLLTNSPMWSLGLRYDKNVTVSNYRVINPPDSPNTDGIDPLGTNGLTVSNADINTGDDNIAIKSGLPGVPPGAYYAPPYNLPRIATSNVTISNSIFRRGHGLSVGSETINGVNHIRANTIQFLGTDNGFRIKTGRDRGNQISDMVIQNLRMVDVPTPISLSEYYPTVPGATQGDIVQPENPATRPYVHDISISNVVVTNPKTVRNTNVGASLIVGIPESPIYNVALKNISITTAATAGTYMRLRNVNNLTCSNVTITPLNLGSPNFDHAFDNEKGLTNISGCDVSPQSPP